MHLVACLVLHTCLVLHACLSACLVVHACIVLHTMHACMYRIALYCIVLYCIVLYCIVCMYCMHVLYCMHACIVLLCIIIIICSMNIIYYFCVCMCVTVYHVRAQGRLGGDGGWAEGSLVKKSRQFDLFLSQGLSQLINMSLVFLTHSLCFQK